MKTYLNNLAIFGGPKAVTASRPVVHRWGSAELKRLNAMVEQQSLFYWNGPQTKALLDEFRTHYPLQWCMPCSSCTASLHIATAVLELPPGSEIITSPVTDMGSVIGILYQQCVPVFADILPHTYNLDPADVRRRVTAKTRALMVVHLAGNPSDMTALLAIAQEYKLYVIEDCAQSWGACYQGKPVGVFGNVACYSFNDFKHISCGDGGIVGTNDKLLGPNLTKWGDKHYDRLSGIRNPSALSPNYRMSEPQAAVATAQLTKLSAIIKAHIRFGSRLLSRMQDLALPGIILPEIDKKDTHSFWFFLLRLDTARFSCSRDEFVSALNAEGVVATSGYIPRTVYKYDLFQNHNFFSGRWPLREAGLTTMNYREVHCPVAEAMLSDSIALPINPGLTDVLIDQTSDAMAKIARHFGQ